MGLFRKKKTLADILKKNLPRYLVVVVLASFVSFGVTKILGFVSGIATGLLGLALTTVVFIVGYLIVLHQHPGIENILTDVIPVLIFAPVVYGILQSFGVSIPTINAGLTLGMDFGSAIISILIADTVYLRFRK